MVEFLHYLQEESRVLLQAPILSIGLVCLGALAAWWLARHLYNERFTIQETLLKEYRERLHLSPAGEAPYSRLSNRELKQRALALADKIREFLRKAEQEDIELLTSYIEPMRSEKDRKRVMSQITKEQIELSSRQHSDYLKQFQGETILLRDEILSRLPKEQSGNFKLFETPINPGGMEYVAADLDRLARSLK